ncbi:HAMP domain-containing protein [Candidatus Omnitrophota bacterium]
MVAENRRRNYFIKERFQTKFILRFCILIVCGSILSGAILYYISGDTVTTAFVDSRLSIVATSDYILPALLASSLIAATSIGIATIFVIMYMSHRIAGPLFKIEEGIKEIGDGNINLKIHLRSSDEIGEMAKDINEMTEKLAKRLQEIKVYSQDIDAHIEALVKDAQGATSFSLQVQEEINELKVSSERLKKAISHFTLENF